MATDGPTPEPCSDDVYNKGTLMFQTASIGGSCAIERWVQRINASAGEGQRVDEEDFLGRLHRTLALLHRRLDLVDDDLALLVGLRGAGPQHDDGGDGLAPPVLGREDQRSAGQPQREPVVVPGASGVGRRRPALEHPEQFGGQYPVGVGQAARVLRVVPLACVGHGSALPSAPRRAPARCRPI